MSHQESFTFEIERVPFKSIFCNANDSVIKLMIFITSGVSYYSRWQMPKIYDKVKLGLL